ncbi:MAG: hypothetical protein KAR16_07790 [Bacteroidales bacterium]|nr:hypothetical protein [Bacteroidales bacterium]
MSLNNLKQVLRLLFKEKRITIINIIGLSVSLACALFMLLWVQQELSYDRFHTERTGSTGSKRISTTPTRSPTM